MTDEDRKVTVLTDALRIKHRGHPACRHERSFTVDPSSGDVTCGECKASVSPVHALISLAHAWRSLELALDSRRREIEALVTYEPHLKVTKRLEHIWRGKMLPACPHCNQGIEPETFGHAQVWNPKKQRNRPHPRKE